MKLRLVRTTFTDLSTIGHLEVDGRFECFTLEDRVREKKIRGRTAIRAGTYDVALTHSPRFGRVMPLLLDVPEFEGIRIHPGNTPLHTEGCILVGETKAVDFIGKSRSAYRRLFAQLQQAVARDEAIAIEITATADQPDPQSLAESGGWFQVTADPLNFRAAAHLRAPILRRLEFGELVVLLSDAGEGWWRVRRQRDGTTGFVYSSYLRAYLREGPVGSGSIDEVPRAIAVEILHAVRCPALNLRSAPDTTDPGNVLALLPSDHLIRKIAETPELLWWKVAAKVHGRNYEGFVHSAYLRTVTPGNPAPPDAVTLAADDPGNPEGGGLISERALDLILEFEGIDQPYRWPGGGSGITLGVGYDLGYHSEEEFVFDWEMHLGQEPVERLLSAIGRRGRSAAAVARRYRGIDVTRQAAEAVFLGRTLPKYRSMALRALPGLERLPEDAQGALVSLVFNRGPGMRDRPGSDRRKEMREVRDAVARGDLRGAASAIERMKRLWTGRRLRGLLRRRDAEAALIRSCLG